jgi:phosphoglycerol transferase MdoB-like AlkP superfamily enzyme
MKRHLLLLLKTYIVTVVVFVIAKVVFIVCNGDGHDVSLSDVWQVFYHGLSLDLSTALYFLVVPLLLTVVGLWVRMSRWLYIVYYAIISVAFSLAFVADTSLYAFWAFKLDASCLSYLSQPEGITASVSTAYLLLRFLVFVVCTAAIFSLYMLCAGSFSELRRCRSLQDNGPCWHRMLRTLAFIALVPLMVIGMRGGLNESTTNIGQVYFSQNQFLNHSAVNPVFSFISSLSHQMGDTSQYHFFDDEGYQTITDGVYTTASLHSDTLLRTSRPDIVIILMESAGEQFAAVMPRLQQLKREGVYFSECYANSWRTDRGTLSLLSGYPSFPTLSVMKMPNKSRTLPSIANELCTRGYATYYIYGGDINFTNMRSYLLSTGWQGITSMDDYTPDERATAKWGVRDDITFQTVLHLVTSRPVRCDSVGAPALIGYSTLSSHEPWDVPRVSLPDDPVLNAFAYLDDCLSDFVDSLRNTPQWDNLLIVITADHGIIHKDIDQSKPRQKNHIPMLWIGGAVREPRIIDVLCNQSDLAATLLAQMGIRHDDFTFSRDVLSASYTHPVVVNNYNNAQWIVDSTGQLVYDFDARKTVSSEGSAVQLEQLSKAIIQATTDDLSSR